jgi:hypothetical protein
LLMDFPHRVPTLRITKKLAIDSYVSLLRPSTDTFVWIAVIHASHASELSARSWE